jgi:NAD(P)-dependent dehydrogenase (short-subunit alcohol dehydrogenase family)
MSGHTIAITGANRGIGLELTRLFTRRGDHVIGLCRRAGDALPDTSAEVVDGVDVTSADELRAAAERLGDRSIDILVNVAGVLTSEDFDGLGDPEAVQRILRQYQVNALGPLLATHAVAGHLQAGSKVALITSRMGSIGDNDSGGQYGYRMSKAALNAAGKSLSIDLAARRIAVGIFHPGFVRTEMTGYNGQLEPAESAALLAERIDELQLDNAGRFLHANGDVLPW